ncbi:MAG: SOS response-associated peptidase [Anaerolineae bacterium]|nr:SOS response-associated peptidase [Thermoflexales bacterium]MDW8408137.1 SOS response-associated peptidase [Anaerolineae bacterium]
MCGRYTLTVDEEAVMRRFHLDSSEAGHTPRFNIAPTQMAPVVLNEAPRRLSVGRWGLIPAWSKDATIGARLINARAETLIEKPAFRTPLKRRRCLVPADGFYEWRAEGKSKTPFFIRLKSGEPFALAGLWEVWQPPTGEPLRTFTIITVEANECIAPFHARMPAILPREVEQAWVDPETPAVELMAVLAPFPAREMEVWAVSRRVNSPANDDASLIEAI